MTEDHTILRPADEVKVYLAGPLFDHAALTGNALLASAVEDVSDLRYNVVLPQDIEDPEERDVDLRDANIRSLTACDAIVGVFNGTEIDSGTVAEFVISKFLDMPAVLLRTDIRSQSEQSPEGDPWNLMLSGWLRTETLVLNGMAMYRAAMDKCGDVRKAMVVYCDAIAQGVVEALDRAREREPLEGDRPGEVRVGGVGEDYRRTPMRTHRQTAGHARSPTKVHRRGAFGRLPGHRDTTLANVRTGC